MKIATRSVFFDEAGKRVRAKKEITGEDGQIRKGCIVIPKGGIYEYNRDLAEWERKAKESRRPAKKERFRPPERESVRNRLRQLQAESKQKPKRRSFDRER